MTAIATILALVPLAAGFNQGSIIAAELGTVVIGGLFSSTFLTLLVDPGRVLARRRVAAALGVAGEPDADAVGARQPGLTPPSSRAPTPALRAVGPGRRHGCRGAHGTLASSNWR